MKSKINMSDITLLPLQELEFKCYTLNSAVPCVCDYHSVDSGVPGELARCPTLSLGASRPPPWVSEGLLFSTPSSASLSAACEEGWDEGPWLMSLCNFSSFEIMV